jgi:LPXTG-site transpeptidase (sortase) family protein
MTDDTPRKPSRRKPPSRRPSARTTSGPKAGPRKPMPSRPRDEVVATEEAPATARTRHTVASWRQRLYRVPVAGTVAYVVWPPRQKASWIRRSLSAVLAVVAILGIGMAAYPWAGGSYPGFFRVPVEQLIAWSNFLSDLQHNKIQGELAKEFADLHGLALHEGDPLTRIEIPSINVDTIVVQGTSPSALRAGAGHYPNTPLPGQKGNVAIAGHRTTYGRPFNRINELKPGDPIILTTPVARYTYIVSRPPWITTPYDWSVIAPTPDAELTLTACHPKGSANQRIIVRAKLTKSQAVTHQAA